MAEEDNWLDRILNGVDKGFTKYMDWERLQSETSVATRAANQNLDARAASIQAAQASSKTQTWLIMGGVALVALLLIKKL